MYGLRLPILWNMTQGKARAGENASGKTERPGRERPGEERDLLRGLPVMVYRVRLGSGIVDYVSAGSEMVVGLPATEIMSGATKWASWVHPKDADRVAKEIQTAVDARESYLIRYRVRTDRAERWVIDRGAGVFGLDGRLSAIQGVVHDFDEVTREEKRTRQELERTLYHLHAGEEAVAIFEVETARLCESNAAFQKLCRTSKKEIASRLAKAFRDEAADHKGRPASSLIWCRDEEEKLTPMEFSASRFEVDGRPHLRVEIKSQTHQPRLAAPPVGDDQTEDSVCRALLDDAGVACLVMDDQLRLVGGNEAFLSLIGRPRFHGLEGQGLGAWIEKSHERCLEAELKRCLIAGASRSARVALLASTGKTVEVDLRARAWHTRRGKRLLALCQPVAGTLGESATAALDSLPGMVWRTDKSGQSVFINREWREFTGRTTGEALGNGWFESVHPEDRGALLAARENSLWERDGHEIAYRIRHSGGEYFWMLERCAPWTEEGAFLGLQGFVVDFTIGRLLQEELAASEARAKSLEEISPVGIFRADCSGRCHYANKRWCEISDLSIEESAGLGWTRTIHPDDREAFMEEWRRFARAGDVFNLQFRMQRRDGAATWVLCQAKLERDAHGEPSGILGTLTDLDARHHLEQEQLKLSKLESLGVLAGGIAHDFNNQLTPVILNLAHVLEGELNEETRERLEEAKRAAEEASTLTRQLLTFAKGGQPVIRTQDLPPLVRTSMNFALRGTKVKGELVIEDGLWPVRVDGGQINQVVQNLVINSCQAMEDGGKVTIALENVHSIRHPSLAKRDGRHVQIRVTDTGHGISPEHVKRIFDPYFTTKSNGHGLGLASALSVIQKHSGEMGVESEPGKGTTFSIFLPASEEPAPAAVAPVLPVTAVTDSKPGANRRILIMDDEKLIRTATGTLLRKLGYDVVEACDGEEAVRLYKEAKATNRPIDLALMDLTIPAGMGGKDAVVKLRAVDPDARAIVFSGYSNDPIVANHKDYGFLDAIQKPFQPHELSSVIQRNLPPPASLAA